MRARGTGAAFAIAVIAALASAGDDAKSYDIDWRERWKVGQIVTVTTHQSTDTDTVKNVTEKGKSGEQKESRRDRVDAVYVVRCDEVDTEGAPTKQTVFFRSWKETKDNETDDSISGARVEVAGDRWKVEAGREANYLARLWLDDKYGKHRDVEPFKKLMPSNMAVGQVFRPELSMSPADMTKALGDESFDASGVKMQIKLVAVRGTPPDAVGDFEVNIHLPFSGKGAYFLPGVPSPDSGMDVTGTHTGPLTTSSMLGTEHFDKSVTLNLKAESDELKFSLAAKGKIVEDTKTVAGGEIPEPAPAPAKPDAPPAGGK